MFFFQITIGGHQEPEPGAVHQAGGEPEVTQVQVGHHTSAGNQGKSQAADPGVRRRGALAVCTPLKVKTLYFRLKLKGQFNEIFDPHFFHHSNMHEPLTSDQSRRII